MGRKLPCRLPSGNTVMAYIFSIDSRPASCRWPHINIICNAQIKTNRVFLNIGLAKPIFEWIKGYGLCSASVNRKSVNHHITVKRVSEHFVDHVKLIFWLTLIYQFINGFFEFVNAFRKPLLFCVLPRPFL